MTMQKNKLLVVVLVALLVVALVAVFIITRNRGGNQQGSIDPETGYWMGEITFAPFQFGPFDPNRDIVLYRVHEILAERYNIHVTLTPVFVDFNDYHTIMSTRVAAGTAPDIWVGGREDRIREYYRQGAIASWDVEFFRRYAPNIAAYIDSGTSGPLGSFDGDIWWRNATVTTGTGRMNSVPAAPEGVPLVFNGVVYRGDWLEALGVETPPHNLNEWIELMYRFVNEIPDLLNTGPVYAFSESMIRVIFAAHGIWTGFIGGDSHWYYRDGRIQSADTLPEVKEVLELLSRLYADGLIDPTFIMTERNPTGLWAISPAFMNGQIGVSAWASFDHFRMEGVMSPDDPGGAAAVEYWAINGREPGFVYGPWIVGPRGHYGWGLGANFFTADSLVYNIALEDNPAKLAMIFRLLDIFATDEELMMLAAFGGREGETFAFDHAGARVTLLPGAEMNARGIQALRGIYGTTNSFHPIQNENFFMLPSVHALLEIQSQPFFGSSLRSAIMEQPPSLPLFQADLYAYRDETFISIIRGQRPVSYFDIFVQNFLARGGQVLEDEARIMWEEQNR